MSSPGPGRQLLFPDSLPVSCPEHRNAPNSGRKKIKEVPTGRIQVWARFPAAGLTNDFRGVGAGARGKAAARGRRSQCPRQVLSRVPARPLWPQLYRAEVGTRSGQRGSRLSKPSTTTGPEGGTGGGCSQKRGRNSLGSRMQAQDYRDLGHLTLRGSSQMRLS